MNVLQTPLVDTHAHLDSNRFRSDLKEVIERAKANGVGQMITVGCDLESSQASVNLAMQFLEVHASVGIHPHDASMVDQSVMNQLAELAQSTEKVVAIGETGLDFYRDRSPRDIQRAAFRMHIRLARELGKPLIVHDRDAHDEVLAILKDEKAAETGGVLHCFSGDLSMAQECIGMGFFISLAGPITYPKSHELVEIAKALPIDMMLLETDCPYLAPQPYRGKRNEPAYVRDTAEVLAQIKGLSLEDVARVTSLNAYRLFGVGEIDQSTRIAYVIRNSLYLNITNRCTNRCGFCAKFRDFTVKGHQLCLEREPSLDEVLSAIGDPSAYQEVVFCGYGEPLTRLDLVKQVAVWIKQNHPETKVRVNTDGQANLLYGRNIIPELKGLVDAISVSLNAPDADTYQALCQSRFGTAAYPAIQEFLRLAMEDIPSVTATAVNLPEIDIQACRLMARELGVTFRERHFNELG